MAGGGGGGGGEKCKKCPKYSELPLLQPLLTHTVAFMLSPPPVP